MTTVGFTGDFAALPEIYARLPYSIQGRLLTLTDALMDTTQEEKQVANEFFAALGHSATDPAIPEPARRLCRVLTNLLTWASIEAEPKDPQNGGAA